MTSICSISWFCDPGEIALCTPQQKLSDIGLASLFPDQHTRVVLALDIRDSRFQHLAWQQIRSTILFVNSWANHVDEILWNNKYSWEIYNHCLQKRYARWLKSARMGMGNYFTWPYAWLVDLAEDIVVDIHWCSMCNDSRVPCWAVIAAIFGHGWHVIYHTRHSKESLNV